MRKGYTGWVLTEATRKTLLEMFPPKYDKVVAHHITFAFNVTEEDVPPEAIASVVGYRDSFDGLEVLVVEVNGSTERDDGSVYHITWSLDPDMYTPKDSNKLLETGFKKISPFMIDVKPFFNPFG